MYSKINAINWSSLKNMNISPKLFKWRQTHPLNDSVQFLIGRAVHCAVLEPNDFSKRYLIRPEGLDLRTREGQTWSSFVADREILSYEQGKTVYACVDSIVNNREAMSILEDTLKEKILTWDDDVEKLACKARVDAVKNSMLIELKTTSSLGKFKFMFKRLLYNGQLAFYADGAMRCSILDDDHEVRTIAVETHEPYDCGVYRVPRYLIEEGRELYQDLLSLLSECVRTDMWPGQCPGVGEIY